jgi:cytochrome P450
VLKLDREFVQKPHESYERLRRVGPVHRASLAPGLEGWLVTGYTEARSLLNDPRLSKDNARAVALFPDGTAGPHASPLASNMLNADPPDHTRLRRLVNKAFTPRTVSRLRPRIEEIAQSLLDDMAGDVDLMESFAFPLPITVICELLGIPGADREKFRDWSTPLVGIAHTGDIAAASAEMSAYLGGLVAEKRATPSEDLLSDLVHVSDQGDHLSEADLLAMAFLLLVAGFETTVNLIGNSVLALLRHPGQLAALRADPALMPKAVEEFLRFESPLHSATVRVTTEPVRVGEVEIPADEFVMISLLAANRDGGRFADPDRLDISRATAGHLAFGYGIHHCVGAPLARLEGEIALGRLLKRFPDLALDGEPAELRWNRSTLMRGLSVLPVRLG